MSEFCIRSDLLHDLIAPCFRLAARDFKSTIASLSPQDKATVHDALVKKIKSLQSSTVAARGFARLATFYIRYPSYLTDSSFQSFRSINDLD